MEKEDQAQFAPPGQTRPRGAGGTLAMKLAALFLTLTGVAAAAGFLMSPLLCQNNSEEPQGRGGRTPPAGPPLFRDWTKPDVALLLTGEQHGYLQPCGCSEPQKGGLARRYNFLRTLTTRGWTVVGADVGDIAQESGPQARLKYEYSMKALERLGYTAVGIGKNEVSLPIGEALADTVVNNPAEPRVVVTNLLNVNRFFPDMIEPWTVSKVQGNAPKVGIAAIIGPALAKKLDNGTDLRFTSEDKVLPVAVKALQAAQAELLVLLYQGDVHEATDCAKKYPQFQVILHTAPEPEPSSRATLVGNTMLVNPGHKGRFAGVVGAFRTGDAQNPFQLRYQLVDLDPVFETPEGKDNGNPIHTLMQEYAQAVKDGDYLRKYMLDALHPLQIQYPNATYVGSEACKQCHKQAYKVWKEHPHSHAHETLKVRAKRPSLRQFDGECLICHVTGFAIKTGFQSEAESPKLLNVGCEACHGPGSMHVANTRNVKLRTAMNPFKSKPGEDPKKLEDRIFNSCFKCHDPDNSVNFDSAHFPEYFKKTFHTLDP